MEANELLTGLKNLVQGWRDLVKQSEIERERVTVDVNCIRARLRAQELAYTQAATDLETVIELAEKRA